MYPFKAILIGEPTTGAPARQLLSAHAVDVEASFPDVAAATSWLSQAPAARRLFVIYAAGQEQLDAVKLLRSACVGQPILALAQAGESNSQTLMRLMRAGVDQVVLLPIQPSEFQGALDSLAWQFGYPVNKSSVIAVVGVTPGCGTSTIAVNLAFEIAHRGHDCVLVEASHRMGKLAGQLGVTPRFTTRDLVAAQDRLDVHMVKQALIPLTDHLHLVAAAADEVYHQDVGPERIRAILKTFRQAAELSVLRVPYNVNDSYFATLAAVDQIVMIALHQPDSLHDLNLLCETLRRDWGVRTVLPVINRYDKRKQKPSLDEIQEVLEVPHVLTIAADRALDESKDQLIVLRQKNVAGAVLGDIQTVARLLLHEPESHAPDSNGLFAWVKRLFAGD